MASKIKVKGGNSPTLIPLNENQEIYIESLKTKDQVVVIGSSGTGKTFIAATYASQLFLSGEIEKIVLTRPNVSTGRDLGYFPGTVLEKMAPWATPVLEVLTQNLGKNEVNTYIKEGRIEIAPLSTMRGRNFSNAFVILDEAQNTLPAEIKMFLTRIGENTKVVINGDIKQSDLRGGKSGLAQIVDMIDMYDMDIPIIEFTVDDIVRSHVCKQWILAFDRFDRSKYGVVDG